MFGFGSDDKTPKGDIFDIDEIRQLVLDFPPAECGPSQNSALIQLASGSGFTSCEALNKAYGELIKGRYGKIPVDVLEKQLDVGRDALFSTLQSREDFMLSKCKGFLITTCDQERILQDIFARTKSKFVRAKDIADQHDIDVQSIAKLVLLSEKATHDSPLQLLDAPGQSRTKSLELGNSWIHILPTLLALRRDTSDKCTNAHTGEYVAEWKIPEMYGLDVPTFARLAQRFAQECNGKEPLYGFFESSKDSVRYVTKSYLLRKAKRILKQVAMGEEAYCDLKQLCSKYPTLLPNAEAAKALGMKEVLHADGSKYKWHFIDHYAIGDVGLNNTSKRCMETLGPQRYLNTNPFVQAFPPDIRKEVLVLLQNRTVEFWRYCGGEVDAVLGLDEWLVLKTIINDVEFASKRIGRACADDAFRRQVTKLSLSEESERDAFLQKLSEESDLPTDLLLRLWGDPRVKIKSTGSASFDERILELKVETANQLESVWKTRAYVPAILYSNALDFLDSVALKEQLRDLLDIHLRRDLVPATLKRLRAKNLVREQVQSKQVNKLEAVIATEAKADDIMKSLNKFHEKMGFASPTATELASARVQQLSSMVKGMQEDDDAPRLFLTVVLVLLAIKKQSNVLYATGKFAPKLLKLLNDHIAEELYEILERIKNAIKAGKSTEEDLTEMRKIASEAFDGSISSKDKDEA